MVVQAKTLIRQADPEREMWRRGSHVVNILTYGQLLTVKGEEQQNPYYITQGLEVMLDIILPLLKEKQTNLETKKTKTVKGKDTIKAKRFLHRIGLAKKLINASFDKTLINHQELLDLAYRILHSLKIDVLQAAQDLDFNFKSTPSPYEAYQGG